jgi:hypothetical protein
MKQHRNFTVTAYGFASWASYLINGDASGISDDDRKSADAFAAYMGGPIVAVSEHTAFGRPDHGSMLFGDCALYTALVQD